LRGKPKATQSIEDMLRTSEEKAAARHADEMSKRDAQHAEEMSKRDAQHAEAMRVHAEQHAALMDGMKQEHRRTRSAILRGLGLSDHSSDDEERLIGRGKRKLDDASTCAFGRVAVAARLSPPRDGEPPTAVGARVVKGVAVTAARAATLKGRLKDVEKQVTDYYDNVAAAVGCDPAEGPEKQLDEVRRLAEAPAHGFTARQFRSVRAQVATDPQLARACKVMRHKVNDGGFCDVLDRVTPSTRFVPDSGRYNQ
jgi:hypothetical protein